MDFWRVGLIWTASRCNAADAPICFSVYKTSQGSVCACVFVPVGVYLLDVCKPPPRVPTFISLLAHTHTDAQRHVTPRFINQIYQLPPTTLDTCPPHHPPILGIDPRRDPGFYRPRATVSSELHHSTRTVLPPPSLLPPLNLDRGACDRGGGVEQLGLACLVALDPLTHPSGRACRHAIKKGSGERERKLWVVKGKGTMWSCLAQSTALVPGHLARTDSLSGSL